MAVKSLQSLHSKDRPREKLLNYGAEHLTNTELLAIVLGTGSRKHDVMQLSEKILHTYQIKRLSQVSPTQLQSINGVGQVKASKIIACIELAVRLQQTDPYPAIHSTADAAKLCYQMLKNKQTEHVAVLGLNGRNHVVLQQIVAIGTVNAAQLQPRDIFSPVLQHPCTSVIMTHNHPSGTVSPSEDDYQCTQKIKEAGQLLGVILLDHVIVAKHGYFSFREAELL